MEMFLLLTKLLMYFFRKPKAEALSGNRREDRHLKPSVFSMVDLPHLAAF